MPLPHRCQELGGTRLGWPRLRLNRRVWPAEARPCPGGLPSPEPGDRLPRVPLPTQIRPPHFPPFPSHLPHLRSSALLRRIWLDLCTLTTEFTGSDRHLPGQRCPLLGQPSAPPHLWLALGASTPNFPLSSLAFSSQKTARMVQKEIPPSPSL